MLREPLFGRPYRKGRHDEIRIVTDVVRRIKEDIHKDYRLQSIAMEGNVIGLKQASNGHYYMNIRDEECSLRAIVFRSRVTAAVRALREGDHVVVIGAVNVYEKGGALSFIIDSSFQGRDPSRPSMKRSRRTLRPRATSTAAIKRTASLSLAYRRPDVGDGRRPARHPPHCRRAQSLCRYRSSAHPRPGGGRR